MSKKKKPATPQEVLSEMAEKQQRQQLRDDIIDAREEAAEASEETPEEDQSYMEMLRQKCREYELVVDPEFTGPKTLTLKRWPYAVAAELAPMSVTILCTLAKYIAPMMRESTSDTDAAAEALERIAVDGRVLGPVIQGHMKDIGKIVARTLSEHSDNKMEIGEAMKFVDGLDPYDMFQIAQILFSQNLGHMMGNVVGLAAMVGAVSKSPTKK